MASVVRSTLEDVGGYAVMLQRCARLLINKGVSAGEISRQIVRMGLQSVPVIVITAVFTGMVLAIQTAYGLQRFGAKAYVGNIVGLAIIRELGPVLTALMLCGRVGAGIAAEIGSMVATEQVDAMRALGANPLQKLVVPRIIAAMLVVPVLTVFANILGLYGGALMAVYELNIPYHLFVRGLLYTIVIRDVSDGLIKSSIFGLLIVTISCYKALNTRGGTEGVGATTTSSVVTGSIVVLVTDFFLTKFLMMV
jgi:phospholipid/cholesterol/gamma-HCH transport system permease protein